MSLNSGFPPVATKEASILILGSMPGQKSLDEQQYYAHPRNSFWPIMYRLFSIDEELSYKERLLLLKNNHIALWDVLKSCYREGSLDSDIDQSSIEINDFDSLLKTHSKIKNIFFNGTKAEQLFRKEVSETLDKHQELNFNKLPSTSPAHAAMSLEKKYNEWKIIKNFI